MNTKLEGWCRMCGAAPGDPCIVVSGEGDEKPGDERKYLHWARGSAEKPLVLIPDEPPFRAAAEGAS